MSKNIDSVVILVWNDASLHDFQKQSIKTKLK